MAESEEKIMDLNDLDKVNRSFQSDGTSKCFFAAFQCHSRGDCGAEEKRWRENGGMIA